MEFKDELIQLNTNWDNKFKRSIGIKDKFLENLTVISGRKIEILEDVNVYNDVQREVELYFN